MSMKMKSGPYFKIGFIVSLLLAGFQNCSSEIQVTDTGVLKGLSATTVNQGSDPGTSLDPAALGDIPPAGTPPVQSGHPVVTTPPENPFDPGTPGIALLPIQGEWASIAFEDNISDPSGGDRDFNDAVFNYKIAEQYNSKQQLIRIFIEVRLREKLSGNNHVLALSLNGNPAPFFENIRFKSRAAIQGPSNLKVTYEDDQVEARQNVTDSLVKVFSSTTSRRDEVIRLQFEILQPELNPHTSTAGVDYKKYRFILYNHGDPKMGIDIAEINPTDEMLTNAGHYPFGFMIPTDWQPPREGLLVDLMYPLFAEYRAWLAAGADEAMKVPAASRWFSMSNGSQ